MNKAIFITGTPGVGKTTIAIALNDYLSDNFNTKLIKINELAIENSLTDGKDPEKDYEIVNIDKLNKKLNEDLDSFFSNDKRDKFNKIPKQDKIAIVEGHLSHFCKGSDKVIVLRLDPKILENRLKSRNYTKSKINENLEAEALGVCSVESFEIHNEKANEVDTTDLSVDEVIAILNDVIFDKKHYSIGEVDFMSWILD
ncbi:MAG: adenylate kinase family protein [Methanobrevibacter sp.]|jgi:adenylate kinase|nr:adenylate kinase family protein [Methanobrevibacter sp.]